MSEHLIKFDSVSKAFGDLQVLSNISFGIQRGESMGIIGESGSGKTTLLKVLCGLIEHDKGYIYYNNEPILENIKQFKKKFGYVTQKATLLPHLTIEQNIQLPAQIYKETKNLKQRTLDLLAMMKLDADDVLKKYPHQLSGGQKQRVVISRALINDPELLIMDEPFSALDSITKQEIYTQFLEIEEQIQKTVLLVTHDFHEAELIADKIIILKDAKISQMGSFSEIKKNPANEYVKTFIGSQSWRLD